jgi:vacuolar-type H+-ATPase subunit F/Vma7
MEILAFGDAELMDGFALLGIETHANRSAREIDAVLEQLSKSRERALVFVQQDLMTADIPMIAQLRSRGGAILICEVPALGAAERYRPQVEELISRVLGPALTELDHVD